MAFTMSYGANLPITPTKTSPKATAPKTPVSHRGHKSGALRTQAQAAADPAVTLQPPETQQLSAVMDVPEDGAALLVRAEEEALASRTHDDGEHAT